MIKRLIRQQKYGKRIIVLGAVNAYIAVMERKNVSILKLKMQRLTLGTKSIVTLNIGT